MSPWFEIPLQIFTLIIMLIGLIGLVIPIFPGVVVIWLSALGYGLVAGFGKLGAWMFAFISLMMIAGILVDNVMMGAKAREGGASWLSIGVGLIAGVVGMWVWPPIGGLITAPLALFATEMARTRDYQEAFKSTRGLMIGCGWAFFIRFGLGVVMIGLWSIWAWGSG